MTGAGGVPRLPKRLFFEAKTTFPDSKLVEIEPGYVAKDATLQARTLALQSLKNDNKTRLVGKSENRKLQI
jgi:hypothetical protein